MNIELNNTIYSDDEIVKVAEKMALEYEEILDDKNDSKIDVAKIASLLSEYPFIEEKKYMTLEYASRIKYEIQYYINIISPNVDKDPRYFSYKNDDFAAKKAMSDMYGYEIENNDIPKLIKYCLGNAYFKLNKTYDGVKKKLILNNK